MRSLQRLAISVAVVLVGVGAVSASGTVDTRASGRTHSFLATSAKSGGAPMVLAQKLKAPGTVESRVLKRLPPGVIATKPLDPQAILKEDCTFTNGGVAHCLVWDCDTDGVCIEYGQYCVDSNGRTIYRP